MRHHIGPIKLGYHVMHSTGRNSDFCSKPQQRAVAVQQKARLFQCKLYFFILLKYNLASVSLVSSFEENVASFLLRHHHHQQQQQQQQQKEPSLVWGVKARQFFIVQTLNKLDLSCGTKRERTLCSLFCIQREKKIGILLQRDVNVIKRLRPP